MKIPGPCVICGTEIPDYDNRDRPLCDGCEGRYAPVPSVSLPTTRSEPERTPHHAR